MKNSNEIENNENRLSKSFTYSFLTVRYFIILFVRRSIKMDLYNLVDFDMFLEFGNLRELLIKKYFDRMSVSRTAFLILYLEY